MESGVLQLPLAWIELWQQQLDKDINNKIQLQEALQVLTTMDNIFLLVSQEPNFHNSFLSFSPDRHPIAFSDDGNTNIKKKDKEKNTLSTWYEWYKHTIQPYQTKSMERLLQRVERNMEERLFRGFLVHVQSTKDNSPSDDYIFFQLGRHFQSSLIACIQVYHSSTTHSLNNGHQLLLYTFPPSKKEDKNMKVVVEYDKDKEWKIRDISDWVYTHIFYI
jgi:hypothetical protein